MESTGTSTRTTATTATSDEVYVYTGRGQVPKDVVRAQIHSSVTKIPDGTFEDCKELKKILFNEGLMKIGPSAFQSCLSLQSINFPSTLIEIDCYAFYSCTKLREVVFNEGLKKIGTQSFEHCPSLESIVFPSTLLSVGKWSFGLCRNLRVAVLNERIQIIDDNAFSYCDALREVVLLDEGVHNMGTSVFSHCLSLESFKLPSLSTRLESIIEVSQKKIIMNKINAIQGIEKRDSELLIPPRGVESGANWNAAREIIDTIISILDYHEVKEATTTIELAFWKSEIQSKVAEANCSDVDRQSCCIEVPGPVSDTILQYLACRIYPRGKREKRAFAIKN